MKNEEYKFMPLPLWLYVFGWVFFGYLFISILKFSPESSPNLIVSGMYLIDFGVHEVSHIIVAFLPPLFVASAGSIGEVGFTLLLLFASIREKAYFAAVFAGLWVMLGFMSAGRYMADARAQNLPLIGPGDTVTHDWNYVFSHLGLLNLDTLIGGVVTWAGILIGTSSLLFGGYLIFRKVINDK